jgi:hypothetical protein
MGCSVAAVSAGAARRSGLAAITAVRALFLFDNVAQELVAQ